MNWMNILYPVLGLGGLGLLFGGCLGFAGKIFRVEEDPKEAEILSTLPGANCGGCGYPGCAGCAAAIAKGDAPVNACPVGGAPVAEKIAAILGVSAEEGEAVTAFVHCSATCEKANQSYDYCGISDCEMAVQLAGKGPKSCSFGCLGMGSCVKACPFGAIHIENGIAKVDSSLCRACGKCVAVCPKHLITLVPVSKKVRVGCSSLKSGKEVLSVCKAGCIGCGICEKTCPFDAIHVVDHLAVIDYTKCKNCGLCANKCPKGVLTGKKPLPKKEPAPETDTPA